MWFGRTPLALGGRVKVTKGPHRNRTGVITFLRGYASHVLLEEEPPGSVQLLVNNQYLKPIRHTHESERYRDYFFDHCRDFYPER